MYPCFSDEFIKEMLSSQFNECNKEMLSSQFKECNNVKIVKIPLLDEKNLFVASDGIRIAYSIVAEKACFFSPAEEFKKGSIALGSTYRLTCYNLGDALSIAFFGSKFAVINKNQHTYYEFEVLNI